MTMKNYLPYKFIDIDFCMQARFRKRNNQCLETRVMMKMETEVIETIITLQV